MKKKLLFAFCLFIFSLSIAQQFEVDTIQFNGNIDNRINYVYMSDGYQAHELDKFITDVEAANDKMFLQTPYKQYKNFFNVFAIRVPSNESGAAMDPNNLIDNYFGSTFWYQGIERFLVPTNQTAIFNVLNTNFPEYDHGIILVNSTKYGGSGMAVATASIHSQSAELIFHELGHSFALLRDEYWPGSYHAWEAPNMTQNPDSSAVPWKNWLGHPGIGIYEHDSPGNGWYKPHHNCKMEYLGLPFCPVCTEAHVDRFYDFVNPVDTWLPNAAVIGALDSPLSISVQAVNPYPNTMNFIWVLNGDTMVWDTESIQLDTLLLFDGGNSLQVIISDTTSLSRKHWDSLCYTTVINWTIQKGPHAGVSYVESSLFSFELYPNPVSEILNIDYLSDQQVELSLYNMQGVQLHREQLPVARYSRNRSHIDVSSYTAGLYLVRVSGGGKILQTKKVLVK